jgi:hypothetical protein
MRSTCLSISSFLVWSHFLCNLLEPCNMCSLWGPAVRVSELNSSLTCPSVYPVRCLPKLPGTACQWLWRAFWYSVQLGSFRRLYSLYLRIKATLWGRCDRTQIHYEELLAWFCPARLIHISVQVLQRRHASLYFFLFWFCCCRSPAVNGRAGSRVANVQCPVIATLKFKERCCTSTHRPELVSVCLLLPSSRRDQQHTRWFLAMAVMLITAQTSVFEHGSSRWRLHVYFNFLLGLFNHQLKINDEGEACESTHSQTPKFSFALACLCPERSFLILHLWKKYVFWKNNYVMRNPLLLTAANMSGVICVMTTCSFRVVKDVSEESGDHLQYNTASWAIRTQGTSLFAVNRSPSRCFGGRTVFATNRSYLQLSAERSL